MCSEHRTFLNSYQQAVSSFSYCLRSLSKATTSGRDYVERWNACEDARRATEAAREDLNRHTAEHR